MKRSDRRYGWMAWVALGLAWGLSGMAGADTEINNEPMGVGIAAKPNLMFVLDASGSMGQDWTPDSITDTQGVPERFRNCRDGADSGTELDPCKVNDTDLGAHPPFHAAAFNLQYYNPAITYTPGVDQDGESLREQNRANTLGWTRVQGDPYRSPTVTQNIVTAYPERVFCTQSFLSPGQEFDTNICRANNEREAGLLGANFRALPNVGHYAYPDTSFHSHAGVTVPRADRPFRFAAFRSGRPYYFVIRPIETGTTIDASTLGGRSVVWCDRAVNGLASADLEARALNGFGTNIGGGTCQAQRTSTHNIVRYGRIERVDLIDDGRRFNVGTSFERSYDEEMTNFANWFAFSRTRILTMKSAAGKVFSTIGPEFRVGFITICPYERDASGFTEQCTAPTGSLPVEPSRFLRIDQFQPVHKTDFFSRLYSIRPQGSTPLPEALSRVGRYFAGVKTGINAGMISADGRDDPVQFSCQQNFALLTTDGFTQTLNTLNLRGAPIGDLDGALPRPYFDAFGVADTLADVAQYYYQTDLRPAGSTRFDGTDISINNVRTTPEDPNDQQHMVTVTLGLGVDGQLAYRPDYVEAAAKSPSEGDFAKISEGTLNWPQAVPKTNAMVDDLWHAAVNGRGRYFSARDPESLVESLTQALASIVAQTGAAAAAATSSLELVQGDNFAYTASFRTREWDGNLQAFEIILDGANAGNVAPTPIWDAGAALNGRIQGAERNIESPERAIYTLSVGSLGQRKPFKWGDLSASERALFTMGTSAPRTLTQIPDWTPGGRLPDPERLANATNGQNLVNYIRGHHEFENRPGRPDDKRVFRRRDNVLGDIVSSQPQFARKPPFDYDDMNYGRNVSPAGAASFKSLHDGRRGMVYVGANDGMLHAFDADTGAEQWAYVPRTIMPELFRLADRGYDDEHRFYVDGTFALGDVCYKVGAACSAAEWRTILVGGYNAGGRGYFALDVTDPDAGPTVLWEFSNTDVMGKGDGFFDRDLGLSYGNPLITKIDDPQGSGKERWVVIFTSGLNNVLPGDGKGYLYILDPQTGEMLQKIATGAGTTDDPSGLNKIAGFVCVPGTTTSGTDICSEGNSRTNNFTDRVYATDIQGRIWRFDVNDKYPENNPFAADIPSELVTTRGAHLLAVLRDAEGNAQPITTRPELGEVFTREGPKAMVFVGTGKFLGQADRTDHSQQSIYAITDDLGAVTLDPVRSSLVQQTMTELSPTRRTVTNEAVDLTVKEGWFIDFPKVSGASTGERVNVNMTLQLGTLVIPSNIPNDDSCSVGGESWINAVDFRTGGPVSREAGGLAGLKITGALTVGVNIVRLPDGTIPGLARVSTGGLQPKELPFGAGPPQGRRVSWREIILE